MGKYIWTVLALMFLASGFVVGFLLHDWAFGMACVAMALAFTAHNRCMWIERYLKEESDNAP